MTWRRWLLWVGTSLPIAAGAAVIARRMLADHSVRIVGQCPPGNLNAPDDLSHAPWDQLLKRYVDDNGQVDYDAWRSNASDRQALKTYLETAACVDPDQARQPEARLAYWINVYNALTILGILQADPIASVRDLNSYAGGYRIWDDLKINVAGRDYSLNQIEHEVLRPLSEPRIHFALVCGANGCPKLRDEAYSPDSLNSQMDDNARDFFQNPGRLLIDPKTKTLRVSPILDWYANDFGTNEAERLQSIKAYLPPEAGALIDSGSVKLDSLPYDWRLNDKQ